MDGATAEMITDVVSIGVGFLAFVVAGGYFTFYKIKTARQKGDVQGGAQLERELQELRNEMANLRDTTTRYDMSFDTALQRLENRMAHLEQKGATSNATGETESQQGVGGR